MARPLSPEEVFPAGSTDITQRFVSLQSGVRVRIAERGSADGIPVVMFPGWGGLAYMFRHALGRLPERGVRAIVVDPRGFGLSDHPTTSGAYTIDAYVQDILAVLDVLGLDRAVLMGQSMAGAALLRVALRHPARVAGLVLINPVGLVPLRFMPLLRLLPRPVMVGLGRRLVPRWVASFVLRYIAYGDPRLASERDVDEYWAGTQVPGFAYSARTTLTEFDWRPLPAGELAPLAVPTMVMLGASDRLIANTVDAAQRVPGAIVEVLPGGHCVHEENAAEAYRLIGDFVVRSAAT